ncbi:hypothetical protein [Pseudoduganella namucuonensis]|uniref:Uncharacterized protein n=1 Tax=Pseudoduganella namucuonensis TaxID=1035707 RepID=A0A1I7FL05_9BURK|nr:hypothetical protein [Pseudoduganella namucuonensis]SFU36877.1 hypothetical protein SAMN05216552_1002120 [Pseudoduganella namucuonensis]
MTSTPMIYDKPFARTTHVVGLTSFACVAVLCIVISSAAGQGAQSVCSVVLASMATFGMFAYAAGSARRLADASKTLGQLRAPAAAWTRFLRDFLGTTSITWLVLSVMLMLQFELRPAPKPHWLSAGALVSLSACLGVLFSLTLSDLLPRLRAAIHSGMAFVVMVSLLIIGLFQLNSAFAAQAGTPLAAAVLCWPALALGLLWRWQKQPAYRWSEKPADLPFLARWLSLITRYQMLGNGARTTMEGKIDWHGAAAYGAGSLLVTLLAETSTGEALTLGHLLGVFGFVYVAYHSLRVRDLHWRTFVAPGGMRRRDIARNIFFSTLRWVFPVVLLFFALFPTIDYLVGSLSGMDIVRKVWRYALILPEVPLIVAAAIVIKALPRQRAGWYATGAWVAAWALAAWTGSLGLKIGSITTGPAYLLGVLAATMLLLALAQRLWTPRKMLEYLKLR